MLNSIDRTSGSTPEGTMPIRILLVDDEWVTLRLMKFGLERFGYEVACAADGEEAWAAIEEATPDLVLTDFHMPRLDGLGLAHRVRSNPKTVHIPVVMSTHKAFELSEEEVRERFGIVALLPKPFNPRMCALAIRQALEERRL